MMAQMNLWEEYFGELFESQKEWTHISMESLAIYDEIYTEDPEREIDMAELKKQI